MEIPWKDTQAEVPDWRHTFFHSKKRECGVLEKKEARTLMRCVIHRQSWEFDQRKRRRRFPPTLADENKLSSSLIISLFTLSDIRAAVLPPERLHYRKLKPANAENVLGNSPVCHGTFNQNQHTSSVKFNPLSLLQSVQLMSSLKFL